MLSRWAYPRAFLISFAIFLGLVDGCPIPPDGYVRSWQKPIVAVIRPVQKAILSPFKFVTRWTRTHQRWALFQAVGRKQWRFEVQGRVTKPTGTDWVTIYRAGDDQYDEEKDLLEYRKVRAIWNPTDAMSGYTKFGNWYMQHVLDTHPEFAGVRLRIQKVRLYRGTVTDTGEYDHYQSKERPGPRPIPPGKPLPGSLGHLNVPHAPAVPAAGSGSAAVPVAPGSGSGSAGPVVSPHTETPVDPEGAAP